MKICKISRSPLKKLTKKYRMGRYYILKRIELMGHEVESFIIDPLRIPNLYLAYALGIALAPFSLRKIKPDLVLTDDLESSIAALLIKFVFKIPFVFNFVDDYSLIASYEGRMLRYHALKYLERIIPKLADLVIVVGPRQEEFCIDLGIPIEKLMMVSNGVDTKLFKPGIVDRAIRDKLNPQNDKLVLFVGRINKYYKLDVLLLAVPQVLRKFPKTKFIFVGGGDDIANLKALSRNLRIDNSIIFTGFRPTEEIPQIINLSNVCVFPLPTSSALAIFEYMACAKPVVLPRGGSSKMAVSKRIISEDIVLQVEASPEGFAQGIIFLLNNEEVGKEMGRKARERVVTLHDWNTLSHKYQEALKVALKRIK